MALHIEKIIPLLIDLESKSMIADLLLEYAALKKKLDKPDQQSWYFLKGLDMHKQRLIFLFDRYEGIRIFFNQSTVDDLIETVNDHQHQITELEQKWMGMLTRMKYEHLISEKKRFNEFIQLKSRINKLQTIDYYLDNPEDLLSIIE